MDVEGLNRLELLSKIDTADPKYFVAELETGYVTLSSKRQYFRGYCFFTCKFRSNELYALPTDVRAKHLFEMTVVAESVQTAVQAAKMNVAYLGNSLPQVHWNIIPRFGTDPLPRDAIWSLDRQLIESVVLTDAELGTTKWALTEALRQLATGYGVTASFNGGSEAAQPPPSSVS